MRLPCFGLLLAAALVTTTPVSGSLSEAYAASTDVFSTTQLRAAPQSLSNNWHYSSHIDFNFDPSKPVESQLPQSIQLPHQPWKAPGFDENNQVFNYIKRIAIEGYTSSPSETYAVFLDDPLTANQIMVIDAEGNQEVFSQGSIAFDPLTIEPSFDELVVPLRGKSPFVLWIQMGNKLHGQPGLWYAPVIGTFEALQRQVFLARAMGFLTFGAVLLIGLYHLIIAWQRRSDKSALFFGIFCMVMVLREVTVSKFISSFIPNLSDDLYSLHFRIEYATMPLVAISGILMFEHILGSTRCQLFAKYFVFGFAVFMGLMCLLPLPIATSDYVMRGHHILILCTIIVVTNDIRLGLKQDANRARLVGVGFSIVIIGAINDILIAQGVYSGRYIATWTFLTFLLVQATIISKNFARAFQERDENQRKLLSAYQELDEELLKREALIATNQKLEDDIDIASQQLIQADKLATLGTVVAGVAHDIASPAGLILGARELIGENRDALHDALTQVFQDDQSPEARELFEHLEGKLSAIDTGTAEIGLGIGRINAIQSAIRNQSRQDIEMSSFELRPVVEECLVILNTKLKSIKLSLDIDPALTMTGRRSQIGQALTNLLSNAADAVLEVFENDRSFEPEILVVAQSTAGRGIELSVEDNGPGIPTEHREKIKEAFFTTKGVGKGTGLGMPIVIKILEAHEMSLDILTSELLGGAKMHIAASSTGGDLS